MSDQPTENRPFVIRITIYQGDYEDLFDAVADTYVDFEGVTISGRFEDVT